MYKHKSVYFLPLFECFERFFFLITVFLSYAFVDCVNVFYFFTFEIKIFILNHRRRSSWWGKDCGPAVETLSQGSSPDGRMTSP